MGTRISTRPRLQRSQVVLRAMEMADADGLEAVTIRRLATELGVTPMALYWHFADKDALLAAISEHVWDEAAALLAGDRPTDGWESLRAITTCLITALRRHPGCAELAPLAVLTCPSGLELTERSLAVLAEQGFDGRQSAELAHFLLRTAITLVASRPGGELGPEDAEEADAHIRAKRVALASLPPDRYPHIAATAEFFADCPDVEGYFARVVDFVIGGLRRQASSA